MGKENKCKSAIDTLLNSSLDANTTTYILLFLSTLWNNLFIVVIDPITQILQSYLVLHLSTIIEYNLLIIVLW